MNGLKSLAAALICELFVFPAIRMMFAVGFGQCLAHMAKEPNAKVESKVFITTVEFAITYF
jgi:hypothetical protein